jgi:hypothetical protein
MLGERRSRTGPETICETNRQIGKGRTPAFQTTLVYGCGGATGAGRTRHMAGGPMGLYALLQRKAGVGSPLQHAGSKGQPKQAHVVPLVSLRLRQTDSAKVAADPQTPAGGATRKGGFQAVAMACSLPDQEER